MFTVALAKGALLQESVSMFSNVGLDFSAVLDDSNRRLMVPSACGRAKALLVRNSDVPVYVSYGQAQLGIVGFDVLQEQKLQVFLLQLVAGYKFCRLHILSLNLSSDGSVLIFLKTKDIFLKIKQMSILKKGDTILDIGANDGTLLKYFNA